MDNDIHKFHGWWYNTMINSMNAFSASGPFFNIQDQYIFINTSVYPVQIHTTFGTDKYPRLKPNVFDPQPISVPPIPNVPTANSYFFKEPNKLINGYNAPFKGKFDPNLTIYAGNTLKLIDDETINTFTYYNYNYFGKVGIGIYKKIHHKPKDTSKLDWNDPVNLFKYYISANSFSNLSKNMHTGAKNYVGKDDEKEITRQFLNEGFYRKTQIRKIRITNKKYYNDIGIPEDAWTTIYTDCFSYITPGSTVKIKGAKGTLSFMNGKYKNGIGLLNAGGNLLLKPEFIDYESYNDLFNSFLLNLDTSSLSQLADPNTGWVDKEYFKDITISVRHSISINSTYDQFCASCAAWFYAVFRTATHVERDIYTYPKSCRLINTFGDLQLLLKQGNANQDFQDSMRYGQPFVSWYYHNFYDYSNLISGDGLLKTGGLQNMVNNPHPVNYYNTIFKYDVAIGNYLINVQNLVFTIRGILDLNQPDPVTTFNYPFIKDDTAGRAHFEGLVIPANVVNGVINPIIPKNYASMGPYHNDKLNLNAHYFGQINPILTKGKIIGYLYKRDCKFLDPDGLMINHGLYNKLDPNNSNNPRVYRESLSAVYSKMMQWFNNIGCESIIIDQCGNLGGDPDLLSIIEFVGSNREVNTVFSVPKNPEKCPISYYKSNTVSQAARQYQKGQYLYVSMNEKLYPGSVFKGTKEENKKVVFMTDIFSRSAGDISVNYFIGKENKYKGYLGANIYSSVVGCFDGREFGFISVNNSFPPNINKESESKNLVDQNGNPVAPFDFNIDWGQYFLRYSDKKLSQLKQNKEINLVETKYSENSNALPISFEKTVFPDFGFTPKQRSYISGWKKLHNYPPNPNDQTTWTYLYLDAAISYLNNQG